MPKIVVFYLSYKNEEVEPMLLPEFKEMVHRSVAVSDRVISTGPDGVLDVGFGFANRFFNIEILGQITGNC